MLVTEIRDLLHLRTYLRSQTKKVIYITNTNTQAAKVATETAAEVALLVGLESVAGVGGEPVAGVGGEPVGVAVSDTKPAASASATAASINPLLARRRRRVVVLSGTVSTVTAVVVFVGALVLFPEILTTKFSTTEVLLMHNLSMVTFGLSQYLSIISTIVLLMSSEVMLGPISERISLPMLMLNVRDCLFLQTRVLFLP